MPYNNKEAQKAWREANKEKIAARKKVNYQNNKEKIAAQQKAYQQENKEKITARKKAYYQATKEWQSEQQKAYKKSKKDGFYTVYYLLEEQYIGMTDCLQHRLNHHKSNKRHVQDVEIVGKYQTKKGALRVEAALHSMGYLGRNSRFKQQTLKQLI